MFTRRAWNEIRNLGSRKNKHICYDGLFLGIQVCYMLKIIYAHTRIFFRWNAAFSYSRFSSAAFIIGKNVIKKAMEISEFCYKIVSVFLLGIQTRWNQFKMFFVVHLLAWVEDLNFVQSKYTYH